MRSVRDARRSRSFLPTRSFFVLYTVSRRTFFYVLFAFQFVLCAVAFCLRARSATFSSRRTAPLFCTCTPPFFTTQFRFCVRSVPQLRSCQFTCSVPVLRAVTTATAATVSPRSPYAFSYFFCQFYAVTYYFLAVCYRCLLVAFSYHIPPRSLCRQLSPPLVPLRLRSTY